MVERVYRESLESRQSVDKKTKKTSAVRSSLPCLEALGPPGLACKGATVN